MDYNITLKYTSELLRGYGRLELENLWKQARKCRFELKEQSLMGGRAKVTPKPYLFKKVKGDITRIKTILAEKGW